MSTIPSNRQIYTRLLISRPDGVTWVDLADYLARATVALGDVSAVGTGSSGADAAVRTMQFDVRNAGAMLECWPDDLAQDETYVIGDENTVIGDERDSAAKLIDLLWGAEHEWARASLSPRDRSSAWNQDSQGYAPLLWPTREVILQVAITSPGGEVSGTTQRVGEALGTVSPSAPLVALARRPIKENTVRVYLDGVLQSESAYTVDHSAGTITFTGLAAEQTATSDYVWWCTPFHGYLGDRISVGRSTVSCEARDLAKMIQDTYIEMVREYGSKDGAPAETVIQAILDDNLGTGAVTLACPVSPGFMIHPYRVDYQTVWDAIQAIAQQIGWWLGYRWDHAAGAWQLTLMEPPRDKTVGTADWWLSWDDDIYTQGLDVSDADIRNTVRVTYKDRAAGKRLAVAATDAISILEYGRRAMGIEERDASLIDTNEEAAALAEAAVADLRDMAATTRIDMPLLPEMDVFDGLVITNPTLSSTDDFYGVESVRHTLEFGSSTRLRTEVIACGRVIGSHRRWLRMQTRPGGTVPITGGDVIGGQATATLVVAASDSSWRGRQSADYVCDGDHDEIQINDALTWLVSDGRPGGKVMLLEGTYYILNTVELPANVTLEGQGPSTIITFPCSGNPASNAMIRGVGVYGSPAPNIRVAHLTVDGGAPTHEWSVAVGLPDAPDAIVEGITCINAHDGIVASNSPRARIQNCVVRDVSGLGVFASGDGAIVSGCVVATCDVGIRLMGASSMVATGNTCRTCTHGIQLQAATAATVSANACELSGRDGIWVSDSNECQIIGNAITSSSQATDNTYAGIFVRLASSRNNIQHNMIRMGSETAKPKYGIWIDSYCDRNLVTNNDLYQAGKTAGFQNDGTNTIRTAGNRT